MPAVLPWIGLNQITIRFGADVAVSAGDLSVRGVRVADYPHDPARFRYDAAARTATWTLTRPVVADRMILELKRVAGGGVARRSTARETVPHPLKHFRPAAGVRRVACRFARACCRAT
jgi:hypothetical protein